MSARVTIIERVAPPAAAVGNIEEPVALTNPTQVAFQQDAFQSDAFQMSPVVPAITASPFPAAVTIIEIVPG